MDVGVLSSRTTRDDLEGKTSLRTVAALDFLANYGASQKQGSGDQIPRRGTVTDGFPRYTVMGKEARRVDNCYNPVIFNGSNRGFLFGSSEMVDGHIDL